MEKGMIETELSVPSVVVVEGRAMARRFFAGRGNHSEAHLSEDELMIVLGVGIRHGMGLRLKDAESWFTLESSLRGAEDWGATSFNVDTLGRIQRIYDEHVRDNNLNGFEFRIVRKTLIAEVVGGKA